MAKALGGVTILRKGKIDEISDGSQTAFWGEEEGGGSARRCGGQGDFTAGAVGTLLCWGGLGEGGKGEFCGVAAGYGAVMITKKTNELAFKKWKRSFVAGDMVGLVGEAFEELFPFEEEGGINE